MANIFITRRGGGARGVAAIAVSYPEGSVCTCSNGSKTLKARDTSGEVLFYIPEVGNWTVKAVNAAKSASKAVSVLVNKAYSVALAYTTYLLQNGSGAVSWDGKVLEQGDNYKQVSVFHTSLGGGFGDFAFIGTAARVAIPEGASTLHFSYEFSSTASSSSAATGKGELRAGLFNCDGFSGENPLYYYNDAVKYAGTNSAGTYTIDVDVRSYAGESYTVGIFWTSLTNSQYKGTIRLYDVWID